MRTPRYRLTRRAEADVLDILRDTVRQFGTMQRDAYAALLARAATMVAAEPGRPASRPRDELAAGVRSFHIEHAAERLGAAAHILYYRGDGDGGIIILRVLHERMDPLHRV